jgi:glutaminyl-tRNA synthetase
MAVLDPLKVVITNYPDSAAPAGSAAEERTAEGIASPPASGPGGRAPGAVGGAGGVEELDAVNNPEDPAAGTRKVPFAREIYIEREDFREDPPPKFFRLAPGREVRLRYAYFITCQEVVKDAEGNVTELRCTYDPATRGGDAPDGRKVKATLHWVAAPTAVPAEIRLYDHLFTKPDPDDVPEGETYLANLNPHALQVKTGLVEPSVADAPAGRRYQFERLGYFCADPDSMPGRPVFNRTVTLRDTWAKIEKAGKPV